MELIKPYYNVYLDAEPEQILGNIERAGRVCYKSEGKITPSSGTEFVQRIIKNGHESVLEHEKVSVRIICDRGVSHELVRHRIASYSQESTRYCDYSKNGHLTFIIPPWEIPKPGTYNIKWDGLFGKLEDDQYDAKGIWFWNMAVAERDYKKLSGQTKDYTLDQIPVKFNVGDQVLIRHQSEAEDEQAQVKRYRGKIISVGPKHFTAEIATLRGRTRNETFLIADLLTGIVKVRKDLEADKNGTN